MKKRITGIEAARSLLERAPYVELATTDSLGSPVLRTLNGVVVEGWMMFHGAFAGEKSGCFGRPAVVGAYEIVADIPSHFVDDKKACPATTYFRSAQGRGVLHNVEDTELKVRTLQALMDKLQPEGQFLPFADDLDFYKKDLRSTRVFGLKLEEFNGKANIGQDKPPEFTEKIVRKLFTRGRERDLKAIGIILEASPKARPKEWTFTRQNEEVLELEITPNVELAKQHATLLTRQYWRRKSAPHEIEASVLNSPAWVGVKTEEGRLVAAARATSDRTWVANIFDVVVDPKLRGQGLGRYIMERLLEHPLVCTCSIQRLGTRDAIDFYSQLGFRRARELPRDFESHPLVRARARLDDRTGSSNG